MYPTDANLRFGDECAKCYFYNWSAHTLDKTLQWNRKWPTDSSDSTIDSLNPPYPSSPHLQFQLSSPHRHLIFTLPHLHFISTSPHRHLTTSFNFIDQLLYSSQLWNIKCFIWSYFRYLKILNKYSKNICAIFIIFNQENSENSHFLSHKSHLYFLRYRENPFCFSIC